MNIKCNHIRPTQPAVLNKNNDNTTALDWAYIGAPRGILGRFILILLYLSWSWVGDQCLVLFSGYVHVGLGQHILVHPPNHTDFGHPPNYIDAHNPPNHTNDGCHPSHLKLFVSVIFFIGFQKRPSFAIVVLRIYWPRIFAIKGGLLNCGVVASSHAVDLRSCFQYAAAAFRKVGLQTHFAFAPTTFHAVGP